MCVHLLLLLHLSKNIHAHILLILKKIKEIMNIIKMTISRCRRLISREERPHAHVLFPACELRATLCACDRLKIVCVRCGVAWKQNNKTILIHALHDMQWHLQKLTAPKSMIIRAQIEMLLRTHIVNRP